MVKAVNLNCMDLKQKCLLLLFATTAMITIVLPVFGQNETSPTDGPDQDKLLDYYQTQRYTEAAKYLTQYYTEDVQDAKVLAQLGYVNLMAGKLPAAENNYLKLFKLNPKSLPALFSLATIQVKRGNEAKAKSYYKEIIALDSTNFNAYKELANLSKEDTSGEKLNYLIKANQLNPTEANVVFDLCQIYFKMNQHGKANDLLEPALKADSANIQLLKMKMPIDMTAKKYTAAIETGQQLLSYGDSSAFVMNNLAKSYFLILKYKDALTYFLKVNETASDNESLFYNIAMCYRSLRDYKNANLYVSKAIEVGISPKTASYYGVLGDTFENLDKYQEAITAYKRGLLFENNGSLYYNIALVYETKLNDKKNAIVNYNLYLNNFKLMNKNPKLAAFIKNKVEELKR